MAAKKIYAVRRGRETGLFTSWEECKKSVEGFKGAEYKSFTDINSARVYVYGINGIVRRPDAKTNWQTSVFADAQTGNVLCDTISNPLYDTISKPLNVQQPVRTSEGVIAYVDGSFDASLQKYAFGCILLLPDGRIIEKSGSGNDPDCIAIRNVAGEMLGAMYAVLWAYKNNFTAVDIRYDYAGIEKWAVGDWQAKNPLTQKYAKFMSDYSRHIHITYVKVKAHTGNQYNEAADQAAKAALKRPTGVPKIVKEV